MDSWRRLLIIAILLVVSAVVSYLRGYVEAQNGKKLERDAEENGSVNAKKMLKFFEMKEQQLKDALWTSQMLLLIFESLILGVLAHDVMDEIHKGIGAAVPAVLLDVLVFLVAGFVFAFFYVVFIRRLFAAFGTNRGKKTEKYSSWGLIRLFYAVSLPFSALCGFFTKAFLNLLGVGAEVLEEDVTEDEILTLVDIGEENGTIESGEKEMIENVLDFTDVTAGDLLTHRTNMTAVPLDIPEKELIDLIEETGYSRIPVYDEDVDSIIGVLSTKLYLLNRLKDKSEQLPLRELLYAPHFVPESVHATTLLSDMKKNKVHMAVVVDEYGGTAGIITMEDLLEEIVGNIYDETDDPATENDDVVRVDENLWRVKGATELEKLWDALGVPCPENLEYETVAGLVFSRLTVIPDDGTLPEVDCAGLHIKVEKMTDRRIEEATVSILPKSEAPA